MNPGRGDDLVDGGAGSDTLSMFDAPAPLTINLRTGTATGEGTDSLTSIEGANGSRFGDTFIGNSEANGFGGLGGADVAYGGGGPDSLNGGDAPGTDRLYGGAGNDILRGFQGADLLRGGLGHDTLEGGPGDDYLRARDGMFDRVRGEAGFDRATVDSIDAVTAVERS